MGGWYSTKKATLDFRGETITKVIASDLDKVYLTDRYGNIHVYKETGEVIDDKHKFKPSKVDGVAKKAIELRRANTWESN